MVNHLKLTTAPLFLVLLAGCAKPGLQGVSPYWSEVGEADQAISSRHLSPSRELPRRTWKPTLDRIAGKIVPAARATCLAVGASNCSKADNPIEIVDDPTINAFVDGQHKISVHAGLLTHAASDEEIAVVLAHEYGHIFARHIEKQQQNAGLGLLAGAAAGLVIAGTTGIDVTKESMEVGYGTGASVYSQESELEADYYAALILENSGIDLDYGRDVLIRLARSSRNPTGTGAGMWGEKARLMAHAHPADNFRIARWLGVSRSIEDSKRLGEDPKKRVYENDNRFRQDAWDRLLGSLHKVTVRWVNSQNGHSGTLSFKNAKYERECELSCVQIEQADYVQEQQKKSLHWMCKVDGKWLPKESVICEEERQ